ncbi:MAG TPA: cobalt-precorrin-6A reductase [Magnetovibrio sp.]
MLEVLILSGTQEGRAIAEALLNAHPELHVVSSLAGVTTPATPWPGEVRVGGFGGADGLADYLRDHNVKLVIDATHPFAERITGNAVKACAATDTPYLRLDRPQWTLPQDTDVVFVPDAAEAARLVARTSSAVLLTIGGKDVSAFSGVEKVKLVVRAIEMPADSTKLDNATYVIARPPFTVDGEVALMRQHAIDTVVTKASGGDATRAKLDAAALVGARLVILRRPPPPDTERAFNVEEALAWVTRHL